MARVKANSEVSQAILDSLARGRRGMPKISNTEWGKIKKVALGEMRKANNPRYEFKKIVKSFADMNAITADANASKTETFIDKDLAEAKKDRLEDIDRGPSVRSWSGSDSYRSYS